MQKRYIVTALFAAASLATLPACSMLGMHRGTTQTSSAAPERQPALSQDLVRQVQTKLQQDGQYKGNIDGVWGEGTKTALENYQKAHNLTADGQLDSVTLSSLQIVNSPSSNSAASSSPGTSSTNSVGAAPATPPPAAGTPSSTTPAGQ